MAKETRKSEPKKSAKKNVKRVKSDKGDAPRRPKAGDSSSPPKAGDTSTPPKAKVWKGGKISQREIDLAPFGTSRRSRLLKQAVVAYQANARQGTHKTKTRAETSYSEAKPWPQKHTGRARAGDKNSPLWRHGGTIHGPQPRDYRQHMPRRMLREALRSALYGKLLDGEVAFVEALALDAPSTKSAAQCLKEIGAVGANGAAGGATVVLPKGSETLWRSFRNIDRCEVVQASEVNALHVLRRRQVVLVGDALAEIEQRLAPKTEKSEAAEEAAPA